MYTLGCDISKYQNNQETPQRPDFNKLKDGGCKFVIIRASQNVSIDPDFIYNWNAAKEAGLIRGAYHFLEYRPGIAKPVLEQARFFDSVLGKDPGDIPPAVDYERPNEKWPDLPSRPIALANLEIWFKYMDANHKKGILYTNPNTILYNLRPGTTTGSFLLEHDLWVAQYFYKLNQYQQIEQPIKHCKNEEEIGARQPYHGAWSDWLMWQFGTPSVGIELGMESKEIDLDFFHGDEKALMEYCGIKEVEPVMPTYEEHLKLYHGWK
jgi:GH25 family lysozyme M1 (1,4-beta-N-acetylmuramidase)